MHKFICTTAIALLGASSLPALATIDSTATQRVEITAPRDAVAAAQAVLAMRGEDATFDLSNGRTLVVTPYASYVEMRYGKRLSKVMRHDGQGNFVSRDGSLSLQFEIDRDGEARVVKLSAPASWF
ncbi:MAG: hypothetical protein Q7U73_17900 [Rubrivivax sp.]|nr:hypothetical protein [Rubrivivax sp.]